MLRALLAPFRARLLFRGVFLLLALATVALALTVLLQEKQLSYNSYQSNFSKTAKQIAATLRHPTGQLALLNPTMSTETTGLHPLLLPFSALDFDDQSKVQQAIAMSGCLIQYGQAGSLCAGIGNNPWAGAFVYLAGYVNADTLVAHQRGANDLQLAHRLTVSILYRGQNQQWIAPFELESEGSPHAGRRGHLTGFLAESPEQRYSRPVKDFRGWMWQKSACINKPVESDNSAAAANCKHSTFFSLRLPVPVWQDALFNHTQVSWPPADLNQMQLHLSVLGPGAQSVLLDSGGIATGLPFALNELQSLLLPGETLRIRRISDQRDILLLQALDENKEQPWNLLTRLIRNLPVDQATMPLQNHERITTPVDDYDVLLSGNVSSVNKTLSGIVMRIVWFVAAMLLALLLAWLLLEIGIIRRISLLTKRASDLSDSVKNTRDLEHLDVSDLRGNDELGLLASCLHNLLRRVKEDIEREAIRTEQEKEMWHAVGHEIMSPLQSLMVLHGNPDDQSNRYIQRMQQAIRVLYGHASPSEAFQATVLEVAEIDLALFLQHVAENAPCAGIPDVQYIGPEETVMVRADEYSLEDVVTHILRNANRHRHAGTTIRMELQVSETSASVSIQNDGAPIAAHIFDQIFEYGVSDQAESGEHGGRGQGLFVAKTYMAKMGGTITAQNTDSGVTFVLSLQRGLR
jgi:signal transduction histidine kinase